MEPCQLDFFSEPTVEGLSNIAEAFDKAVVEFSCTDNRSKLRHALWELFVSHWFCPVLGGGYAPREKNMFELFQLFRRNCSSVIFSCTSVLYNIVSTSPTCFIWSSTVLKSPTIRPDRIRRLEVDAESMSSKLRWKVYGSLRNPKGTEIKSKRPRWITKVLLSLSSSLIGISHYLKLE